MEDIQTAIVLLSIIVGLLSVIIVTLLAVVIALLVRLNTGMKSVSKITTNVASATEWLSPTKVFSEISGLFRKK